jgi:hypothetical protein
MGFYIKKILVCINVFIYKYIFYDFFIFILMGGSLFLSFFIILYYIFLGVWISPVIYSICIYTHVAIFNNESLN